ncbi:Electron transfer flavoprotein-ubiquinone oxidoreductase [Candidatus Hodgkinia cicadicola]|nr:Electron transfer flavoprotein-ubiquinone oxidoreductase [Candidatus Hodgkinia cicadicola]
MYDAIIVGAGPAGLAAGIKLKSLDSELKVGVFEKANQVGGHLISGTILQNSAYNKYAKQYNLSSSVLILKEHTMCLTETNAFDISWVTPTSVRNVGNSLLSINELCTKMCLRAKQLGVNIHVGSSITDLIVNNNTIMGVTSSDGAKILAKHTILAEGAFGTAASKLIKLHNPKPTEPQTYALGIREEWTPASNLNIGTIWHTTGWPSAQRSELAGGFIYAYPDNITIGYVTHLCYTNSYVCPYNEFVKFKSHPLVRQLLINKTRTKYGAKIISTGGVNALPEVCYPGCTIIGCAAGLVNMLKLKGVRNALQSGENAAEKFVSLRCKASAVKIMPWFAGRMERELNSVKNVCKLSKKCGKIIALAEHFVANAFKIRLALPAANADGDNTELCASVKRPPKDWKISDTGSEALRLAKPNYESDAPHISVCNSTIHKLYDLKLYDKLTTRLCPAKVYSWIKTDKHYKFRIQHENCIQCKSCCVKPAMSTIRWTVAAKGGGPNYN